MSRVTVRADRDAQGKTGYYIVSGGEARGKKYPEQRVHGKAAAVRIQHARQRIQAKYNAR